MENIKIKIGLSILGIMIIGILTACGGGGGSSSSPAANTPTQTITNLRASGALPTLDRTTSIKGTDSNNNGIRDDVDTWITSKNLPATVGTPVKVFAASMQSALSTDVTNQQAVTAVNIRMMSAISCAMDKATSASDGAQLIRDIKSITANTKERSAAYMAYSEAQNGIVVKIPKSTEACNVQ